MNNELEKEQIIEKIQIVIDNCCKHFKIDNTLLTWKNTAYDLNDIKLDINQFNFGIKLWINITENEIIKCNNIILLTNLSNSTTYTWLKYFLDIKNYANININ